MAFTVGISAFFVTLFIHGVILLGKFFVVKPLRNLYNGHYSSCWIGHGFYIFGSVVVIVSALVGGLYCLGVKIGLVYATVGMGIYVLYVVLCILSVIVPKMKAFNQELERKRG